MNKWEDAFGVCVVLLSVLTANYLQKRGVRHVMLKMIIFWVVVLGIEIAAWEWIIRRPV